MSRIRLIHSVTKQALHDASLVTYELRQGLKSGVPFVGNIELRVDDREPRDMFLEALCKRVREAWMS